MTKINQQSIAEIFRQMSIKAGDDLNACLLIRAHYLAEFFGIELFREGRRAYQVTKHYGKLPTFSIGRRMLRGTWFRLSTLDFGPWTWDLSRERYTALVAKLSAGPIL